MNNLNYLEAEAIHIIREMISESENPVMLYSIGKDSAVMLHLIKKAFYPSFPPFPLLHIDTTWKFQEMYKFRDKIAKDVNMDLIVYQNPEAKKKGINPFDHGTLHTDLWKTEGLKQALNKYNFDAALIGARRDEEKSRAKERVFSFDHNSTIGIQKNNALNFGHSTTQENQRGKYPCFSFVYWTELDIWQYIYQENIEIVSLYFAALRPTIKRNGLILMVDDNRLPLKSDEKPELRSIRFRTLGCYPLTGAILSEASTLKEVIQEMLLTITSERQGRIIDKDHGASMEMKKTQGYF